MTTTVTESVGFGVLELGVQEFLVLTSGKDTRDTLLSDLCVALAFQGSIG